MRPKHKLVAVQDGCEKQTEWSLQVEYDSGEQIIDLPWPPDWPERVDGEFLQNAGFDVVSA